MALISVVHGPNLNLLGTREPHLYGRTTLDDIHEELHALAAELGHRIETFQSNHEGALVDHLQGCRGRVDAVLLNAAAYTHTSVAIRDAIAAVRPPILVVEVHLTLPEAREAFRRKNLLSGVVDGRIAGFGAASYVLALRAASTLIAARGNDG
jgi:3-dehydroquinate dehydratase-2